VRGLTRKRKTELGRGEEKKLSEAYDGGYGQKCIGTNHRLVLPPRSSLRQLTPFWSPGVKPLGEELGGGELDFVENGSREVSDASNAEKDTQGEWVKGSFEEPIFSRTASIATPGR